MPEQPELDPNTGDCFMCGVFVEYNQTHSTKQETIFLSFTRALTTK